jgi:hypothetical protein
MIAVLDVSGAMQILLQKEKAAKFMDTILLADTGMKLLTVV